MAATCTAVWADGVRYLHTSGSGHALVTDSAAPVGAGTAPSPMELVLHALVGCLGVDLSMILAKMKQPVTGIEISVTSDRAEEHPKIYTDIRLHVKVHGAVSARKLERAINLSQDTYCSVSAMLAGSAEISHTWEIVDQVDR